MSLSQEWDTLFNTHGFSNSLLSSNVFLFYLGLNKNNYDLPISADVFNFSDGYEFFKATYTEYYITLSIEENVLLISIEDRKNHEVYMHNDLDKAISFILSSKFKKEESYNLNYII